MVIKKQCFRTPLALIVAGTGADRIYVTPVIFRLRVDSGVAVNLAGRGLQDWTFNSFCKAQHVDCAVHGGFGGLDRIMLVLNWRRRASEVVDFIYFDEQGECDIMANKFEPRVRMKMFDISFRTCKKVVRAENLMPFLEQPIH
jgi:hypothetical protein